jgi:hypothetical protein
MSGIYTFLLSMAYIEYPKQKLFPFWFPILLLLLTIGLNYIIFKIEKSKKH